YRLLGRKDGYLGIGNNAWVKEEHFNVR
ncbi:hypothetical protein IES_06677, partial [Bacillus cereus BMG1.7]